MRRLTIQTVLDGFTSYGIFFQKLFFELRKHDIHVAIRPIKTRTVFRQEIPSEIMASTVIGPQPEPWEVLFGPSLHLPTPGKRTFYWTAAENTGPVVGFAADMLVKAEVVAFMNKGPEMPGKKVVVLPLGVDTNVFVPSEMRMTGFCNFGTAGRLAHGRDRKGVDAVIELFLKEFTEDDVRLYVKVQPDCPLEDVQDPRVIINRQHMREIDIVHWLQNLTCYVSGASREGFGFWPLQAMAVGRPVIALRDSGLDYVKNLQNAATPARIVDGLRWAYQDREKFKEFGRVGAATAERWSVEVSVKRFIEELERCGALKRRSVTYLIGKAIGTIRLRPRKECQKNANVIHVYPDYDCSQSDRERIDFAKESWPTGDQKQWTSVAVKNSDLPREFQDETRRLPFLKDLVDVAIARAKSLDDVILVSNSDICFSGKIIDVINKTVGKVKAFWFTRREFQRLTKHVDDDQIIVGHFNPGVDCFAFTRDWWDRHKAEMPDMLMGAEGWDSVLGVIIGRSVQSDECAIDGHCYHVAHVPIWKEGRFRIDSQRYNRLLARKFFKKAGAESPIDTEPVMEESGNLF